MLAYTKISLAFVSDLRIPNIKASTFSDNKAPHELKVDLDISIEKSKNENILRQTLFSANKTS